MKITKAQLKQIIKEEFDKEYSPATKIESRANMISDLISRSVIKMVMALAVSMQLPPPTLTTESAPSHKWHGVRHSQRTV